MICVNLIKAFLAGMLDNEKRLYKGALIATHQWCGHWVYIWMAFDIEPFFHYKQWAPFSVSYLLIGGASQVQLFCFCNEPIDWPMTKKKFETVEAPQNRRFYEKMECLPLWPTYIGEKWRTLGKTYGIKARCYWEHPWETHWEPREHIRNLMGTHWELERNMLGTKEK